MAGLDPERLDYIRELRSECARYRWERNQVKAKIDALEARYAALAPLLSEAIEKLTDLESLRAEYGIH
jgi:hypothetical protein